MFHYYRVINKIFENFYCNSFKVFITKFTQKFLEFFYSTNNVIQVHVQF